MSGKNAGTPGIACPGWTAEHEAAKEKAQGSPYMPPERGVLLFATIWNAPCGCTVRGYGNIPDPVRPMLCRTHASALDLDAYRSYIEDNMERIERGGWTPIGFAEFMESEERTTYGVSKWVSK